MSAGSRLMWKEYRVLRGLWIALAIFGLSCDGLFFLFVANAEDRNAAVFSLAGVLSACFALGAGATLFALEREESTRELLQYLPLTSSRIFASKIWAALSGTLLLTLLLLSVGTTGLWSGKSIESRLPREDALIAAIPVTAIYAVMVLQAMGWSVFFSLRSARPLLAAFLGAIAALTCIGLVHLCAARDSLFGLRQSWVLPFAHIMVTAGIWLIDIWHGRNWLHGRRAAVSRRFGESLRQLPLSRLLWQQWRSSGRTLAALTVLGLILPLLQWVNPKADGTGAVPAVALVLALFGSCTFLSDQERSQCRFFAERGVSGRSLWFSRLLFWIGSASVLAMTLLVAHWLAVRLRMPSLNTVDGGVSTRAQMVLSWFAVDVGSPEGSENWAIRWLADLSGYVLWLALAFGAGQLCSMFFRSGLLAAVFGVILAGVLLAWAALMHMLSIGWWWSVAPLAVALFAATWLPADGWVLDRRRVKAWLPSAAVLVASTSLVLTAVPVYRVLEIPRVNVDQLRPQPTSPASAKATNAVAHLLWICQQLPPLRPINLQALHADLQLEDRTWLAENQSKLDAVVEALTHLPANASAGDFLPVTATIWQQTAAILICFGQAAEKDHNLDLAWARYRAALEVARLVRRSSTLLGETLGDQIEQTAAVPLIRWGARRGQSGDRLRAAESMLQQLERQDDLLANVVWREYEGNLAQIEEVQAQTQDRDAISAFAAELAPWEFTRARRVLTYIASLDMRDARAADAAFDAGAIVRTASLGDDRAQANRLLQTTSLEQLTSVEGAIEARRLTSCFRRAAQFALAVESWRLEHNVMPESLDVLEQHLGPLRPDPYTGRPFLWFPLGLLAHIRLQNRTSIPAKTPLLYSPGRAFGQRNELERLELLRCRSADDSIWQANQPIEVEAFGTAAGMAAGAAAMPMPSDQAPFARHRIIVDSKFTSFVGLAFPIPSGDDESASP